MWLFRIFDRLREFYNTCKKTDWKNYFKGNGSGTITYKKFTGWKEMPNDLTVCSQWIIVVQGGIRSPQGNSYYRNLTESDLDRVVEKGWIYRVRERVDSAEKVIDLYAESDCTCRRGYHVLCPHHKNWKD